MGEEVALKIRPYARLLTMLGEQLIKNERIALVELIKNSYDADASWVTIDFENFGDAFQVSNESKIIIEDDGDGMTSDVIKDSWMNPATPYKYERNGAKHSSNKRRIVQGEKGIGRFSALKLGKKVKIITRPRDSTVEYVVNFDFSKYDDEFTSENGEAKKLYLEDINISMTTQEAQIIVDSVRKLDCKTIKRDDHGTRIEISDLKGNWTQNRFNKAYDDISKLNPLMTRLVSNDNTEKDPFDVYFLKNGEIKRESDEELQQLDELISTSPVLKITDGYYDADEHYYSFKINGVSTKISFNNEYIRGLKEYKDRFEVGIENSKEIIRRYPECGPFKFSFYIFDLSAKKESKYYLDKDQKEIVKAHRIYLYRDGIRVYPYGDRDNDWLGIDTRRGTYKASDSFSNDQIIGIIEISKKNNPGLKDKTNREGLIEDGEATGDFVYTILTFLSYIKSKPYALYRLRVEDKKSQEIFKKGAVQKEFEGLKEHIEKSGDAKALSLVSQAEKLYLTEKAFLKTRAETTEELAGVGLSVEIASHDITLLMSRSLQSTDDLISYCVNSKHNLDSEFLFGELSKIRGMLSFVDAQLRDIQLLFRSSKRKRRQIRVKDMLDKVINIYAKWLKDEKIELSVKSIGSPLIARCTEAVLLQLFINLFDNSVYWLNTVDRDDKEILITLNGDRQTLIFSDNGPGIHEDDRDYIFEPFYSGKGLDGRGLGLYIARQLLERNSYTIELADRKSDELQPGANFVVNFIPEDESDDF